MANEDSTKEMFEDADTNKDGRIDKKEFRDWVANAEELTSSTYEPLTTGLNFEDNTTRRFDRYNYNTDSQHARNSSTIDKLVSYGTRAGISGSINETAIQTTSLEETNRYLERSATNIYRDPNPRIIRRERTESPIRSEQRVILRYFRPPALPPPGPLYIKEVRPEQPPPPPPLVIREQPPPIAQPPPLILRERPPTPPKIIPSETITRTLPPIPVPPRSIVIERFPSGPEKPRDIIIERWLPYGPQPKRREIIHPAPAPINYPQPTHTVIVYGALQTNIVRKLEKLGVTQENPEDYVARYRGSLLDSATLVQQARNAGVVEDISTSAVSSSTFVNTRENTSVFDSSNEQYTQDYSQTGTTNNNTTYQYTNTIGANFDNTMRDCKKYSSSTCNSTEDHALNVNICVSRGARHVGSACFKAPGAYHAEELKQTKYEQHF